MPDPSVTGRDAPASPLPPSQAECAFCGGTGEVLEESITIDGDFVQSWLPCDCEVDE